MCVAPVSVLSLAACSSEQNALCGPEQSLGVVAASIAVGQYEFDETDGGATMRVSVLSSISQLEIVTEDASNELGQQATLVRTQFEEFLDVADEVVWDDTLMSSDMRIDAVVAELNSDVGVYAVTAVDSYISSECDTESENVMGEDAGLPTLPPPAISSPTATDPPIEMLDVDNEARALGETIAALFGIDVESEVALCLGRALSEITDTSERNAAEYQAQFQRAFDACGLDFTIPLDTTPDAELGEE
jgi:hypothetical protein